MRHGSSPLPRRGAPTLDRPAAISAENWGWRHTGRLAWALTDVSLTIEPGERILLVGASGSGKSTLMHALAGVLDQEEGESVGALLMDGQDPRDPRLRGRSGLVQQDPDAQVVMGNVGDEVAFGLENVGMPADQIWGRVQESLDAVGLDLPLDHSTERLSGGQKQRLALASALALRPRFLLLDEPTANLDPEGAEQLRRVTEQVVRSTGATLIVIEHFLEPWLDQVDRIIVLADGRVIADGAPAHVLASQGEQLRADGVWVPGESIEDLVGPSLPPYGSSDSFELLAGRDLAIGYSAQRPAVNSNLTSCFKSGQVTSIVGGNGVGKTTLALTLSGLLEPLGGQVRTSTELRSPDESLPDDPNAWSSSELLGRISMVFQEPAYQFVCDTVEQELALGPNLRQPLVDHGGQVDHYLQELGLEHLRKAHPLSLSGGEKRRLSVATALISAPKVLVLDEPTFGQDRNTWAHLVTALKKLAQAGTSIISVTHDRRFVEAMGGEVIELSRSKPATPRVSELPRPAPIDSVNPVVQLIGLFILTVPLIMTIDVISAAVALSLEVLLLPLLGMPARQIAKRIWPLLLVSPFAAISMLLYGAPGGAVYWQLGPAVISDNSVHLALAIGLRVLAVGLPAVLLLSRIDSTAMADALTQVAHLPSRLVLSSLAGARMVTLMLADWNALARARRSRGLGSRNRLAAFWRGAFSLLAFAIRRAGTLSVTMEARGFGGPTRRSYARKSSLSGADALMLTICVAIPAVALTAAVLAGSFRWFGL